MSVAPTPNDFVPSVETQSLYRAALSGYATGITVVTTQSERGPLGMTANSFTSISLEPPLVMWSPAKSSLRYPHFAAARYFAIHILSQDQTELASSFARNGEDFDACDWSACPDGVPLLENCLTRLECETHDIHDCGDHAMIVGRVRRVVASEGPPLVFAKGQFGKFLTI